jgi:hypothetical protein
MSIALRIFAEQAGACAERQIALVLDGAGWHTSRSLEVPDHVHLIFLPPYSPELQPAETLWPLLNDATANQAFQTLEELEAAVGDMCRQLDQQSQQIASRTFFHWWSGDRPGLPPSNDSAESTLPLDSLDADGSPAQFRSESK